MNILELICKIFDHKWKSERSASDYRVYTFTCTRCGKKQITKMLP